MSNQPFEDTRFYGRRKGKGLKPSRLLLMDALFPTVELKKADHIDPQTLFPFTPTKVYLEIGFGGGEHLAAQSMNNPDIGFIGAEPFLNGVSSLTAHLNGSHEKQYDENAPLLAAGRVDNVRVYAEDIRPLFPAFSENAFDKIFVLYPDPWPKARHESRRFLNLKNLKELHRVLKTTGELRVATDVADYAAWAQEEIEKSGLFTLKNNDIHTPPPDWVPTRYEQKGILAGRIPFYFSYAKIS